MAHADAAPLVYGNVRAAVDRSSLDAVAQHMFRLMLRNMASDGFVFSDPLVPGVVSRPGCIIASPSYPADLHTVDQDYVFNWTRDAAITALELAAANLPARPGEAPQPLIDYVTFASLCQNSGASIARGSYRIDGQPRQWSDQNDGPALQTIAILQLFAQLDPPTQATARTVIGKNVDYLLGVYQQPTTNLWEEQDGLSFFARAVQLRALRELSANAVGLPVPHATAEAIGWLDAALASHWNGRAYVTILPEGAAGPGYDPNIDIVCAAIYGALSVVDPKLLATAALLRSQWADPGSASFYPINAADQARGIGPLLGRYPADSYDGDTAHPVVGGHPWAVSTCNFAEVYYRLARAIDSSGAVPYEALSSAFFAQVGIDATTPSAQAVAALNDAGDRMLNAVIFHSDHLELSEQFDGQTGYEKSVADLTWSYAAFLSAARARTGSAVLG